MHNKCYGIFSIAGRMESKFADKSRLFSEGGALDLYFSGLFMARRRMASPE